MLAGVKSTRSGIARVVLPYTGRRIACIIEITRNFFAEHVTRLVGNNAGESDGTRPAYPASILRVSTKNAHACVCQRSKVAQLFRSLVSLLSYPLLLYRRFMTDDKIRKPTQQTKAGMTR